MIEQTDKNQQHNEQIERGALPLNDDLVFDRQIPSRPDGDLGRLFLLLLPLDLPFQDDLSFVDLHPDPLLIEHRLRGDEGPDLRLQRRLTGHFQRGLRRFRPQTSRREEQKEK